VSANPEDFVKQPSDPSAGRSTRHDRATLTIHSLRREYFDLDLSAYRLTFDDGLYSQYYYRPLLRKANRPMIYFIASAMVRPGPARKTFEGRHLPFVKSPRYMLAAHGRSDLSDFMTVDEVADLHSREGILIGAHSHFHEVALTSFLPKKPNSRWKRERLGEFPPAMTRALAIRSRLAFRSYACRAGRLVRRTSEEWLDFVKYDTDKCLEWFMTHLGFQPTLYCLPFNEYSRRLLEVLESFGFTTFYNGRRGLGRRVIPRIDIDALLDAQRKRHG
jgi:peptidoglycan/xylan/chitin deacetylase (PgdA/CDA1 family)